MTIMQDIELHELMGMLHAHRMQWIELTAEEISTTIARINELRGVANVSQ